MKIAQPHKLPFLEFLGWQIADVYNLTQLEMLSSYERGWRYRHIANLPPSELAFIQQLAVVGVASLKENRNSWLSSEFMNFRIGHHQLIHRVLAGLNCEFLSECRAYFGGGTLISLDLGEYRTSNDIDFICAVGADYRKLRNGISDRTPRILLKDNSDLQIERFTADQYGIRMAISTGGVTIKTEIIAEARFELDSPRQPSWSPVECLSISDCFTSKLLANADREASLMENRYADASVHSRDLIDLAFLRNEQPIPQLAIDKAEAAYRVMPSLTAALTSFQANSDRRFHCYQNLTISEDFRAQLIDGIDLLALERGLDRTSRTMSESRADIFT